MFYNKPEDIIAFTKQQISDYEKIASKRKIKWSVSDEFSISD
jgi:hypothetical protein